MGLIKASNAPKTMAAFSMKDIETTARAILLRAREQAEEFLAAAQAEAEDLKKQARLNGYVEGRQEGLAKGREEGLAAGRQEALGEQRAKLSTLASALSAAAAQFDRSRRELETAAKADVVRLAIAIAERVAKRQGVLDPAVGIANVAEAMKLVSHASDVRIALHPSQMAALREVLPQLRQQWPTLEHIELVEDPSLSPGGCRISTAQWQVDGELDEQLRRITQALLPPAEGGAKP